MLIRPRTILYLIILLAVTAAAATAEPILGAREYLYLTDALRCIKMTPADLLYSKNSHPDLPYRLRMIDSLMANPMDVPLYTDATGKNLTEASSSLPILYDSLAARLEISYSREFDTVVTSSRDIFSLVTDSARALAYAKTIDKLPRAIREPFLVLVQNMAIAGRVVTTALSRLSEEGKRSLADSGGTVEVIAGYDSWNRSHVLGAGSRVAAAVDRASRLAGTKVPKGKSAAAVGLDSTLASGEFLFFAETDIGRLVIGGAGDNEYRGDFSLILELGGDDLYLNRAGGVDGRHEAPVSVCLDLGGENQFIAPIKPVSSRRDESDKILAEDDRLDYCFGGALAGIGILAIVGDDDNIITGGSWSQGAAHLGVGILWRQGLGDDTYRGLDHVQGASSFGVGLLVDDVGNDQFNATYGSQGYGGPAGIGLLLDQSGTDRYFAGNRYEDYPQRPKGSFIAMSQGFGYGLLPHCSGGIGILLDNEGDDHYHLHNQFGMGGSFWYGFGMLIDDGGNDFYETGNPGDYDGYTLGAAIHLALACMIDRKGNDTYFANKIGPAVGWNFSPGWLIDEAGNDNLKITAKDWNYAAAGVQNGCGFLVKKSGSLKISGGVFPSGQIERECGSIGLLLNLGDSGLYAADTTRMEPGLWWSGSGGIANQSWCAGIDMTGLAEQILDDTLMLLPRRNPKANTLIAKSDGGGLRLPETSPRQPEIDSSRVLLSIGKRKEAVALLEQALDADSTHPQLLYELAALTAEKKKNRAIECLGRATEGGYADTAQIRTDVRLAKIRSSKEFKNIVARVDTTAKTLRAIDSLWKECVREEGSHWDKSDKAQALFKRLGRPALRYAIPRLAADGSYERRWALASVVHLGKSAMPAMFENLHFSGELLKNRLLLALGQIGDQSATPVIIPYLRNPECRIATCGALGNLRDRRAVTEIMALAQDSGYLKDEDLRKEAALALGKIGDTAAILLLIQMLDDSLFWVRYPAQDALVKIGAPSIQPLILVAVSGRFPASAHAIEALGLITDQENRAIPVLTRLLNDPDWAFRAVAVEALDRLKVASGLDAIRRLALTETHPLVLHKIAQALISQ